MEEECSYDHNINQPGAKIKPAKKKKEAEAGDWRNFHFKKGQGD